MGLYRQYDDEEGLKISSLAAGKSVEIITAEQQRQAIAKDRDLLKEPCTILESAHNAFVTKMAEDLQEGYLGAIVGSLLRIVMPFCHNFASGEIGTFYEKMDKLWGLRITEQLGEDKGEWALDKF